VQVSIMHVGKTNLRKPYNVSENILEVVEQKKELGTIYYKLRFIVLTAMSVCS